MFGTGLVLATLVYLLVGLVALAAIVIAVLRWFRERSKAQGRGSSGPVPSDERPN